MSNEIAKSEGELCPNCQAPVPENYCPNCGQSKVDLNKPLRKIFKNILQDYFSFDTKLFLTLRYLLLRPGFLSLEFINGRRKRYMPPASIFFTMSFILFFIFSISVDETEDDFIYIDPALTSDSTSVSDTIHQSEKKGNDAIIKITGGDVEVSSSIGDEKIEDSALSKRFREGAKRTIENPKFFKDKIFGVFSQVVFLLLPVFALLLKILFNRKRNLYIQHLIFSTHFHAFVFFILILNQLLPFTYDYLIFSIPIYIIIALRKFYRQKWFAIIAKTALLMLMYFLILGIVFAGVIFYTIFTI